MRNLIIGLVIGTLVGAGGVFAFGFDDNDKPSGFSSHKSPDPYDERMERIDDYWFLKGLGKGLGKEPC